MPIPERTSFAAADPADLDKLKEARQRLIVALDLPDSASALHLIDK